MLSAPFLVVCSLLLADAFFFGIPPPGLSTKPLFGIPMDQWHCGSTEMVKEQAILLVNDTCPALAVDLNHCCAAHDDCYDNQMGRDLCDDVFCDCLERIAKQHPEAGRCKELSGDVCNVVKNYGNAHYDESAKGLPLAPIPVGERQVPGIEKIALEYSNLYEKCPAQSRTIASCAVNYDVCVERTPKRCELGLLRCLEETQYGRNETSSCDLAIDDVISGIMSTEEPKVSLTIIQGRIRNISVYQQVWRAMSRPRNPTLFVMIAFAVLFLVCLLIVVVFTRLDSAVVLDGPPPVFVPATPSYHSTSSTYQISTR